MPNILSRFNIDWKGEFISCNIAIWPKHYNWTKNLGTQHSLDCYTKGFKFLIDKDTLIATQTLKHNSILVTWSFIYYRSLVQKW
jgi:hypothetical protein